MTKEKKITLKLDNRPFDFTLVITVLLLLALGIIMVLSASAPSALSMYGDSYTYVRKQAFFAVLGIAAMFFISKIDYKILKRFYWPAYVISIILLLMTAVPGLGMEVNGARRWVDIKITSFQPSEVAKIGLIIFYAGYLTEHKSELGSFVKGFLVPLAYLLPPIAILIGLQSHLSASIVIILISSIMMIMAGTKFTYFLSAGVAGGSLGITLLVLIAQVTGKGAYRLERLKSFIDPFADASDTGYQVVQGLYAIGSGGLFGVGLGESKQKYLYIPEPHNDFIFAILAEELGFVGCLIVMILFGIFIWRGILASMKAPDSFGSLLGIGITSLIGLQAIMNIAVVTSSMPATGIALPFFSYGGTALLILLASVGVLLNITRAGSKV